MRGGQGSGGLGVSAFWKDSVFRGAEMSQSDAYLISYHPTKDAGPPHVCRSQMLEFVSYTFYCHPIKRVKRTRMGLEHLC